MVASVLRLGRSALDWVGASDVSTRLFNADTAGQPFASAVARYVECEKYYDNTMYDFVNAANGYRKARSGLYRNIRPIRNPMRRAIDWYPGKLYPGAMTPDGNALPDGTPSCLPFANDTPEPLKLAVTQAFLWANFSTLRMEFGRALPTLGDQFGEVVIDADRRKVYPALTHPKYVVDAEWNGSGDLIAYRLEIPMYDPDAKRDYRWGKAVDREAIRTYYDDQPRGYNGQPAAVPNPWGFVPAAWCQFRNVGGQHGSPLSDGVRAKIDELNNVLAPIHDYIGKFVNQGVAISADGGAAAFASLNGLRTPGGPTAEYDNPQQDRQRMPYLFIPKDASIFKIIDNLGLGEADSHVARMIQEVEADLPEATIDDRISQLGTPPSGKALSMMFGAPETRAFEAQANADAFWVKLGQMCVTIGGELANSGAWGSLTEAQARFRPFSLRSFDAGDVDITFLPRPIFPETQDDRLATALNVEKLTTRTGAKIAGLDDDTIEALFAELDGKQPAALGAGTQPGQAPTVTEPDALAFLDRHLPPSQKAELARQGAG